jgi:hypothetical protein
MVEMATPVGTRRVLFAAFRWSDYVPDSDVDCGLYNAGLLSKKDLPKTGFVTS